MQYNNQNKGNNSQKNRSTYRTAGAGRNTAARRPASARTRTASGEPMSRDEVRSIKNMERRKKRRKRQLLIYAIIIIAVITAAIALSITVFFKISSINVTGDDIYGSAQIIEASKLKTGENLFTFSKTDVINSIETKLPYVESVEVKRSPSGKVTLTVTAAKAMLAIDRGDSFILLSPNCKILEDNVQALNEDAVILKSSELTGVTPGTAAEFKNSNDAKIITAIANLILDKGIQNITEIDVTDQSDIKLGYNQRIVLKVGTVSTFEKNVDFIKAALKKNDTDEPYFSGTMDFTIENKAFINDNSNEPTENPTTDEKGDGKTEPETSENTTKTAETTTKNAA